MNAPPRLLAPRLPETWLGGLAALANAALRVALVPVFVTPVFDQVLAANSIDALPKVLLPSAAVVIVGSAMLFVQDALMGRAAATISAYWRAHVYARLLRRRPGELPGTSGGLSSRIIADLREVENFHQYGLGTLIAESATMLAILALLFSYNAPATLLLILVGLPLAFALRLLGHRLETHASEVQERLEEVGGHLQEGLKHHAEVRAFGADDFVLQRLRPANEGVRRAGVRRSALAALQTPVAQMLMFAAIGALVLLLVRSVLQGAMSVGELVGYLTLVALLATPMQLFPRGYALYRQARAASRRLVALLEPAEAPRRPAKTGEAGGAGLLLEGVGFSYPAALPVLQELDLELPARGLCALTGASGSGKTTLLLLLLGFLEPTAGRILIDGLPVADMADAELRQAAGYAPQTSELLRGSVRDNLSLGRPFPDARLREALGAVGLLAAVDALPGGLDYELREDGSGLSGGQKQRLAIARALLGNPKVLLLDEPSANLDAESERQLLGTLREQAAKRLVIAVAHRPALAEAADIVLRLDEGGRVSRQRPRIAGGR